MAACASEDSPTSTMCLCSFNEDILFLCTGIRIMVFYAYAPEKGVEGLVPPPQFV